MVTPPGLVAAKPSCQAQPKLFLAELYRQFPVERISTGAAVTLESQRSWGAAFYWR